MINGGIHKDDVIDKKNTIGKKNTGNVHAETKIEIRLPKNNSLLTSQKSECLSSQILAIQRSLVFQQDWAQLTPHENTKKRTRNNNSIKNTAPVLKKKNHLTTPMKEEGYSALSIDVMKPTDGKPISQGITQIYHFVTTHATSFPKFKGWLCVCLQYGKIDGSLTLDCHETIIGGYIDAGNKNRYIRTISGTVHNDEVIMSIASPTGTIKLRCSSEALGHVIRSHYGNIDFFNVSNAVASTKSWSVYMWTAKGRACEYILPKVSMMSFLASAKANEKMKMYTNDMVSACVVSNDQSLVRRIYSFLNVKPDWDALIRKTIEGDSDNTRFFRITEHDINTISSISDDFWIRL